MIPWLLAIFVTAAACAALYYAAAGRAVNAAAGEPGGATEDHFRLQLKEIGNDIAAGRLAEAEAASARQELAREYLKLQGEAQQARARPDRFRMLMPVSLVGVAALALATYAWLGQPDLPAQPLADRPEVAAQNLDLEAAVAQIEQQLSETPDDARGWQVIAPAYIQLGRLTDAERAYRRVLELSPATADAETDLAEVLLLQSAGAIAGEPLALLQSAAARDPAHVRSRFYLAGEATRAGDFASAEAQWTALIALAATGDEPWLAVARDGLAAAEAGLAGVEAPAVDVDETAIRGMVATLGARLEAEGGTIAEWTQLVRSRLVLEDRAGAQEAYDAAVAAYPDPAVRAELETLAAAADLTASTE